MILVTGATGNVGSEVVRRLAEQNVAVRALTRNADKVGKLGPVEWVQGEFTDAQSLTSALRGVDKVVLISPAHADMVAHQLAVLDAARAAGVKHIVKLSGLGAGPEAPIRLPRNHFEIENRIKASGIAYTFVRPNLFMQVLIGSAGSIASDGAIYAPAGDGAISFTDVRDVAATIVTALLEPGHENQAYEITGPAALTYTQAAEVLSGAIGKTAKYVAVDEETARNAMTSGGLDQWLVEAFLELFQIYRAGYGAAVLSDTVAKVTGRPAHDLNNFANTYRPQFVAA
ncbi:SDR family oxidoreductase [Jeongeupia chitinilytica]|uniref:NAD(P)-dependent oxidoreductase n=1 Tax=Jeongeupia chitinilytica TaxID=1041641 RepID=A0ABQ3H048_9NEIS|nr:SDR family oxidoreductase [Jeongeupia chitinilytica]GHD62183.1 NAD(P)-dependent oxidoreductase [Jeongeupia chitinilytica]